VSRFAVLALSWLLATSACAEPAQAPSQRTTLPAVQTPARVTLTVYSATDTARFIPALHDFQTLYPDIAIVYDDFNTNDLTQHFLAEQARGAPAADLLVSSAMDQQFKLANDGYAADHHSANGDAMPAWARWRDEAFGLTYEPAVIIFNRHRFRDDQVPRSRAALIKMLQDPAQPLDGRVGTYDIRHSGVGYLLASQDARISSNSWGTLVDGLRDNHVELSSRSDELANRVESGQLSLAYNVLSSYAQARIDAGAPIGIVWPEDYTLVVSRTALIPRTAPHLQTAHLLLDYLLSERGQSVLSQGGRLYSARQNANARVLPTMPLDRSRVGPLRPVSLGPGLLVYLDPWKRKQLLRGWIAQTTEEDTTP